jgi:hemoglobin
MRRRVSLPPSRPRIAEVRWGVTDLETRADIDRLLRHFYGRAMVDEVIGYLFTEVARLDLEAHLPQIGNFWEQVLLQRPVYVGQPIAAHVPLHQAATLRSAHFQRWFEIWASSVDELFAGEIATQAKRRAAIIAESMQYRLGVASPEEGFSDAYREALGMPAKTDQR